MACPLLQNAYARELALRTQTALALYGILFAPDCGKLVTAAQASLATVPRTAAPAAQP